MVTRWPGRVNAQVSLPRKLQIKVIDPSRTPLTIALPGSDQMVKLDIGRLRSVYSPLKAGESLSSCHIKLDEELFDDWAVLYKIHLDDNEKWVTRKQLLAGPRAYVQVEYIKGKDDQVSADFKLEQVTTDDEKDDQLDKSGGFPPKVLQCTATLAQPSPGILSEVEHVGKFHRELGNNQKHQVWQDSVARYTKQEMEAAVVNVDRQLLKPYTLAFYYTNGDEAKSICAKGGCIRGRDHGEFGDGVLVSLTPPHELGWEPNAGGRFKHTVNESLRLPSGTPIDTMLMLGVPTVAVRDIIDEYHAWIIDPLYCANDGSYPNCHVVKWYTLVPKHQTLNLQNRFRTAASRHKEVNQVRVSASNPPGRPTTTTQLRTARRAAMLIATPQQHTTGSERDTVHQTMNPVAVGAGLRAARAGASSPTAYGDIPHRRCGRLRVHQLRRACTLVGSETAGHDHVNG
eukprot:COSAG01_NODE_8294_length_2840_cov_1.538854_2_plen_457_part_00